MFTTQFDPQAYLITTKKILAEFIKTHLPGVKVVPAFPDIPDDATLDQPIVEINQLTPDGFTIKRMGNKTETKRLTFNVLVFTDKTTGGQMKRDELSQKLEYAFFKHFTDLSKAGLRYATINPPQEYVIDPKLGRYCNAHVVGVDVLLT